jgi:hypothetical protein
MPLLFILLLIPPLQACSPFISLLVSRGAYVQNPNHGGGSGLTPLGERRVQPRHGGCPSRLHREPHRLGPLTAAAASNSASHARICTAPRRRHARGLHGCCHQSRGLHCSR